MVNLRREFNSINKICFGGRLKAIPVYYAQSWAVRNVLCKKNKPGAKKALACFIPDPNYRCILIDPIYKNDLGSVLELLAHEMLHFDFELKYSSGAHDVRFNRRLKTIWNKIKKVNSNRILSCYIEKELKKIKDPKLKSIIRAKVKKIKL